MKWLLAKLGLPKSLGLYIDGNAITLSQIVATPFGPLEIASQTETLDDEDLGEAISRLIGPLLGKGKFRRTPVSVAVPSERVYFSTRPIHAASGDSAPHVLLREAMRSQNVAVHEMAVDVVKAQPDSREVASIAACDKEYLNKIVEALKQLDVCPVRTEPAPCSLLRLASRQHSARRGAKVVLRLFLSSDQVLTVLIVNKLPMLWRFTNLAQGEEAASLVTACRSILATSKYCGVEAPLDTMIVHGHKDIERLLDVDWMEEQLDLSVDWYDEPALDRSQIAQGAAQGCLENPSKGFDLARSVKPPPTLKQLFPWREAAMELAMLACMGLFLGHTYWTLRESEKALPTAAATYPAQARAQKQKLLKEKGELDTQVQALREFLDGRVLWTSCLRDLALCVPDDMWLTSVRGCCDMKAIGKKRGRAKAKKSFVLTGAIAIPSSGLMPQEVDRLLSALRSDPTLEKDFPLIALDELESLPPRMGEIPKAIFSVVCLPEKKK